MSDPSANNASSAGSQDNAGTPDPKSLAEIASPGIAPSDAHPDSANAKADAIAETSAATSKVDPRRETSDRRAANAFGTALILAPQPAKTDAPGPQPAPQVAPTTFRLRSVAAMVAAAAAVGGIAGALAATGTAYLTTSPAEAPAYYSALSEALGRVDRELTALKSGVATSAKATGQQVTKIAERLDRAEKAQVDSGTKLVKATESIDRVERRVAAASSDVTGAITESHAAVAAAPPAAPDQKRLPPGPIVEGWVVRDVYNGSAMIQNRAGVIQVIPGDNLPGLGRIEQVRRQDGHWVVVTSRGLIVSR